jgi:hypothetical protein
MIEIKKEKKKKKKIEPYYILKYDYMIGDADGDTSEKVHISKDNPYLERYVKLLNSLEPTKGHWGVMLSSDRLYAHCKEGQITEDDYNFLSALMFEDYDYDDEDEDDKEKTSYFKEDDEYAGEFFEGVMAETEYSFLVFEGVSLKYVDEDGVKHKTVIK